MVTKVFLTEECWAYDGIYTKIGKLPGIDDRNEKIWTMLGALLQELSTSSIKEVIIYNDSRMVDEWNDEVSFLSPLSLGIAKKIKDKNGLAKKFFNLSIKKLDTFAINGEISKLQLIS